MLGLNVKVHVLLYLMNKKPWENTALEKHIWAQKDIHKCSLQHYT